LRKDYDCNQGAGCLNIKARPLRRAWRWIEHHSLFSIYVSAGVHSKRIRSRGVGWTGGVVSTRRRVIFIDNTLEMVGLNHASAQVGRRYELSRLPFLLLKHYTIVT